MGLDDFIGLLVEQTDDVAALVHVVVERAAQGREGRKAYACRQLPLVAQRQCVVHPHGVGPSLALFLLVGVHHLPLCRLHVHQYRLQARVDVVSAQLEVQHLSQPALADVSRESQVQAQHVHAVVGVVAGVKQRGLAVGLPVQAVQPAQRCGQVSPLQVHHVLQGRAVAPRKERQEQLVALREFVVQLGVDVIEIEGVVLEVVEPFQENVHVGTAGRHQQRCLVADQRAFKGSLGRQKSDAGTAMPRTAVARAAGDVEHSRRRIAILCGDESFIKRRRAQRIVVESREESRQVAHVVDRRIVVEDAVLHRCAAANLEAAGRIALCLHARQQLY